jgi:hypothetical protein
MAADNLPPSAQVCGRAFGAFGGGRKGLEACAALDALCDISAIDTLLSSFILPLQVGTSTPCSLASSYRFRWVHLCHRHPAL